MDRLVRVGGERAQGGGDVGRLRVVHVADAVHLADRLEAVRNAGKRLERSGDLVVWHAERPRGRGRGRRVLAVVRAADQRLGRELVVGRELDPFEAAAARHDLRAGALEDAQLRVAVGLERAVPVEVVGLEVQQHRHLAGELVHVLELEARQLADDERPRLDLAVEVGQRAADVPRGRSVQDRAQQLGGRRLAVRAGHADEARLQ